VPAHRGDDRLGEAQHAAPRLHEGRRALGRGHVVDVGPGGEGPRRAGQDDRPHRLVGGQRGQVTVERRDHRRGDRVELLGPVDAQRRDRPVDLQVHHVGGHGRP
jgi:hypothetical protein